ncbi:site-specific DNA-methyltransferase [Alteriqipengyuania flavescens]|uniref:DNA-methyltransferase n=1 Tax=Alteriqipengyuania flavescens TaxID=3053610 RepID=UPI0025B5BF6C|nr:site-specific DNA-methyltransferase [Alteriqipengyuania flavescens]WJY19254.1 site-specific DNA-methyltransferase [Alteriqipengyuania flavescens]WJY25195.1 site-specific DNA-methyltransferase [Alteriqipengyuania flavescens]
MPNGQILLADCIKGMKARADGEFNLIVADPPYNLDKDFGPWKESEKKAEWRDWTREWLEQADRLLSDRGNIFVYGIHHHMCWVQCMMYELGLTYRRQIIWHYENGFAGYGKRSLNATYEPLLWFSKSDDYIYHTIREPYKSQARLKHKIVKNGKVWKPHPDGRMAGDIWSFPTLAGRRFRDEKVDHPTQKPLSISQRIVKHFSDEGDTVLVPFAGSGSECVAAVMEGRNYLGFELNQSYIDIAERRLREAQKEVPQTEVESERQST